MIAIIDSGSTKADWIVVDAETKKEVFRTKTIGLNPYFVDAERVEKEISLNEDLSTQKKQIQKVYFYGAGCSNEVYKKKIQKGLETFFVNAQVEVEHDLIAAAYSVYRGKPAIACILGTGSNSCYFDGENFRDDTPSLGFILGDQGGGVDLGKRLIRAKFQRKLPKEISAAFDTEFGISWQDVNQKLYKELLPNKFLAGFSKFIFQYKENPFVQKMIYDSIYSFFETQVIAYPEARSVELNFIGSIAHYYEDILRAVASEMHLNIGEIVRKPIEGLVDYHLKYKV